MASILIVYGSTTGNTEYTAHVVERVLGGAGHAVTLCNAADAQAEGLCDGFDLVLFGCSTWGDATIELQDDFVPLFENFEAIRAKGKKTAVFGCGDRGYTWYCGAVDAISEKLKNLGAEVLDTLKIDGDPEAEDAAIESWARELASAV